MCLISSYASLEVIKLKEMRLGFGSAQSKIREDLIEKEKLYTLGKSHSFVVVASF